MSEKLTSKKIRKALRAKGIKVVRYFPKYHCRREAKRELLTHWVFLEDYGFVILNRETLKLYNHARMKNGLKKLRDRDLNRMAIHRYPRKAFIYSKKSVKK